MNMQLQYFKYATRLQYCLWSVEQFSVSEAWYTAMHAHFSLWSHCFRGLIFTLQFVQEHLLQSEEQKGHCNYYTYEYIHICIHNRLVMAEPLKVADNALKKITAQLECSICLDMYTNPKLLPCFHTFCKKCLERLGS